MRSIYCILLFILLLGTVEVHAFDAGDAIALTIGLIIGVCGLLACIGAYARKKSGQ